MQEEVENRTLTLMVNGSKFTGRMFKAAIAKYMAHRKEVKHQKQQKREAPVIPHRIARKYGVDYAIKRDRSSNPPKFLIFFKSRDADALTSAFNEYVGKKVKKASRPSVLQRLAHFKELVKNTVVNREKRRELER